jgi:hypothetical protein
MKPSRRASESSLKSIQRGDPGERREIVDARA